MKEPNKIKIFKINKTSSFKFDKNAYKSFNSFN